MQSVLGQRDCALELIVVDDGNELPVAQVLADVADSRLRHVRVPHGGVSAARNAGLAVATGRYLRFADADDVLELESTARLLRLAAQGAIAYEDTVVCDEHLQPQRTITSRLQGDVAVACLLGELDCRHVSMLFPAEVVRRAGPWDTRLRVRQDFDFVLRCLEHAPACPGSGTATWYRRHDASATRSRHAVRDAQRSTRLVLRGYFARHPELRRTATAREAWRRARVAEATTALHQNRPWAAAWPATALLAHAPMESARWWVRTARATARVSGATTARTMARVRSAQRGTAR